MSLTASALVDFILIQRAIATQKADTGMTSATGGVAYPRSNAFSNTQSLGSNLKNILIPKKTKPNTSEDEEEEENTDDRLTQLKIVLILFGLAAVLTTAILTSVQKQQGKHLALASWVPGFFSDYHYYIYTLPFRFASQEVQVLYLYMTAFVFLVFYNLITIAHTIAHSINKHAKTTDDEKGWLTRIFKLSYFSLKRIHFYRIWTDAIVFSIVSVAVFISLGMESIVFLCSAFGIALYAVGGLAQHELVYELSYLNSIEDPGNKINHYWMSFTYLQFWIHLVYGLTTLIVFWSIAITQDFGASTSYYWTLMSFYLIYVFFYPIGLIIRPWTRNWFWNRPFWNEAISQLWVHIVVAVLYAMNIKEYQLNFLYKPGY